MVVIDAVIQPLEAAAGARELVGIGTASRSVAVQLDHAWMRGLQKELPLLLEPLAASADLFLPDQLGGDVRHPQRAIAREQRDHTRAVAHHRRISDFAAQRPRSRRGQR
jgi:hypothetical protein